MSFLLQDKRIEINDKERMMNNALIEFGEQFNNDYKTFITFSTKDAFVYAQNRIRHNFETQVAKNGIDNAISYVAVVERYRFEGEDNYLVRGIIRYDKDGYSVLFNPEYVEAMPKNAFDEWLQLDDDEDNIPNAYKKRRNK